LEPSLNGQQVLEHQIVLFERNEGGVIPLGLESRDIPGRKEELGVDQSE
jgi:hypothetical protein